MVYYVLEIQSDGNTGSVIPFAYGNDKAEAESKFHAILSVAAKSSVPYHSAFLMSDEGFMNMERYKHVSEESEN